MRGSCTGRWLSNKVEDAVGKQAAIVIERAVVSVLQEREVRTADVGGNSSTSEVASAVSSAITHQQLQPT